MADSRVVGLAIAERHGEQRARLGWRENEIHRELEILREELERSAVQAAHTRGIDETDMLASLRPQLELARDGSLRGFARRFAGR